MKKSLILILLFAGWISGQLQAQEYTQTVRGTISDADTKLPLPGASVLLVGSEPARGTVSKPDGTFRMEEVPVGRQTFLFSYLGYEDAVVQQVQVSTGRELVLNVELKEAVERLDEVKIVARRDRSEPINQMVTVSASQITVESTSRVAAGINDPGRTAQSVAGVTATDDENNELVIRGNSPRGMLWRMEGIEIPNPNHFTNGEGGSGGGVSALSTMVLANSDFLTGAFPAEYGNALSGVFDLRLRKGNSENREYAFQLGVMGAQAALEGPFKKGSRASYLLNYRYSTLKYLDRLGINISGGDISPDWQDLSFKAYLPTRKAGYFSVWGLGGFSSAGYTAEHDTSSWEYRSDRWEETEKHNLAVTGITHNYLFKNSKSYLRTVAAFSHSGDELINDTLDYDLEPALVRDRNFFYNTLSLSSYVNEKFNSKNVLRAGLICHLKYFSLDVKELQNGKKGLQSLIGDQGHTSLFEAYVQWKFRMNERVDINSGIHATYLRINRDYTLEPRLGIIWKITHRQSLSFGGGLHSRVEPVSIYLASQDLEDGTAFQPNRDLKMTRAAHAVIGYNRMLARDFRLKAEIYYQYLFHVPVKPGDTTHTYCSLNFGSGFTSENFVNEGRGRNYGLELTLEKFFSRNWYLLATGSLFESKYTMPDGIKRNTLFNSRYIGNLVAGKEFRVGRERQNILGLNFRSILRGGYRTVPVDLEASIREGSEVRVYERAFETKAPDYFRIDLGISFRRNRPSWSWFLSLDIQNATDRANIWDEYYSSERQEMYRLEMVGLIPVLNYRVEF